MLPVTLRQTSLVPLHYGSLSGEWPYCPVLWQTSAEPAPWLQIKVESLANLSHFLKVSCATSLEANISVGQIGFNKSGE